MAVLRLLRGFLGWEDFRRGLQVRRSLYRPYWRRRYN